MYKIYIIEFGKNIFLSKYIVKNLRYFPLKKNKTKICFSTCAIPTKHFVFTIFSIFDYRFSYTFFQSFCFINYYSKPKIDRVRVFQNVKIINFNLLNINKLLNLN